MPSNRDLVAALIQEIVDEEVDKIETLDKTDKALSASEKRRKEFQKTFADVFTEIDSLNLKKNKLNLEADAAAPPAPDPNVPPAPATPAVPGAPAPDATGAPGSPPGTDPNAPATGVDPTTGAAPGTPGAPGDPNDPNAVPGAEGETGDATGGGSGFGGFGGGGGGGGSGGGEEDPASGGGEESSMDGDGASDKPEGDPIEAMVAGAQELLNQTQDPATILKSLKGQIQTLFQEPEHALGLVKALYDTKDSILQAVAQRLYLFIKASR